MSLVSIIVPIRNEASFVSPCLDAITKQTYRDILEVLIVDGMSNDGTTEIVREFIPRMPQARLLNSPGRIAPNAMNIGVLQSTGEIIIRIDGHCIIEPDYVEKCVEYLTKRHDVECVGGPIASVSEGSVGRAIANAMSSPFGVGDAYFRYLHREAYVDTVAFGAYRRPVFDNIGLFDEELIRNQDDEFNYRLREFGGKILLVPEIRAQYSTRSSFRELWRQYHAYGYWKVRVMQKHPKQMQLRQFVPPLFVAALVASSMAIPFTSIGLWSLGIVGGSYAIANIAASIFVGFRKGWKSLPLLPLAFATLHLSYGTGFLIGLVRFWDRWGDRHTQHAPSSPESNAVHPT